MSNELENTIVFLMEEYKRLMEENAEYKKWEKLCVDNNESSIHWKYNGKVPSMAEMARVRMMLKDLMYRYEKNGV